MPACRQLPPRQTIYPFSYNFLYKYSFLWKYKWESIKELKTKIYCDCCFYIFYFLLLHYTHTLSLLSYFATVPCSRFNSVSPPDPSQHPSSSTLTSAKWSQHHHTIGSRTSSMYTFHRIHSSGTASLDDCSIYSFVQSIHIWSKETDIQTHV